MVFEVEVSAAAFGEYFWGQKIVNVICWSISCLSPVSYRELYSAPARHGLVHLPKNGRKDGIIKAYVISIASDPQFFPV